MARDHARIKVSIWDDPDFLCLTVAEQHAYFALASNKGLSRCGVIDYIPARFEHLAEDMTSARFRKAIAGLRGERSSSWTSGPRSFWSVPTSGMTASWTA